MTCAALDNRPVHALIRTRVEQTVLGAGEGWRVLAQEISGKSTELSQGQRVLSFQRNKMKSKANILNGDFRFAVRISLMCRFYSSTSHISGSTLFSVTGCTFSSSYLWP